MIILHHLLLAIKSHPGGHSMCTSCRERSCRNTTAVIYSLRTYKMTSKYTLQCAVFFLMSLLVLSVRGQDYSAALKASWRFFGKAPCKHSRARARHPTLRITSDLQMLRYLDATQAGARLLVLMGVGVEMHFSKMVLTLEWTCQGAGLMQVMKGRQRRFLRNIPVS